MPVTLLWLKRDLRVEDHAALAAAARAADEAAPVLPLYVIEPELWAEPDRSGRHWDFLRESLQEARVAFAALGVPLVVRIGSVLEIFQALADTIGVAAIHAHEETGSGWTFARDDQVRAWARDRGIPLREHRQFGVLRGLKDRDGWAAHWERMMGAPKAEAPAVLPPLPGEIDPGTIPDRPPGLSADAPCPGRQPGGRAAGLDLLGSFLSRRGARYHQEMSSPLTAQQACSRLSAHLAYGTLSMREIVQAVRVERRRLADAPPAARGLWPAALNALDGRLHWHCHFIQKLESAPEIEWRNMHPGFDGMREDAFDAERFKAWTEGRTGFPMVDACMRMLVETGWINFRMRAMLTSFAAYHLWLHWREPALHLARLFTDYEPGIHYSQMQMQSGTTGVNTPRIYNPVKQGWDHDPDARFIRRWVPELARLEDPKLAHEPWRAPNAAPDYPAPIVDLTEAARFARSEIARVRRSDGYREAAGAIQRRLGSRRSGLKQTGGAKERAAAARRAATRDQMSFDL
ncbi:MAG: FAD-binding domain-containing protein [Marivibrio sp.]|uniref:FAD-binding domain-containing protein n=1 Tax=Marivibrio sp. TaxID=2039719 RepID=UPI0032EC7B47